MDRTVPSVEDRNEHKLRSLLGDCQILLQLLAPAVAGPIVICLSEGEVMLPGSKMSLCLTFSFFCFICLCSAAAAPVAKSFVYLTYGALLSFVAGRVFTHVVGELILYLDSLLAAFFLGFTLAQRGSGTWRAISNALTIDNAGRYLWLATSSALVLRSLIPKSDVVSGPVLWPSLLLYTTLLGYSQGAKITVFLRMLRVAAFGEFLVYRHSFHSYFAPRPEYEEMIRTEETSHQHPLPPSAAYRGDQKSLLVLSLVLIGTVLSLIWCSGGQPLLATHRFSIFILSHLFCSIVYYSTDTTRLASIFLFLSYTWLAAFVAGTLVTDVLGMVIMHMDTLLAAALFGVTLAQHRHSKGTQTAMLVTAPKANVPKESDRKDIYLFIGFVALCYSPRLVWLVLVDSPALDVVISFFGAVGFLQIIHIICVVSWLNNSSDSSPGVLVYFACVAFVFFMSYLIFGELVGFTILWLCFLASSAFLGYHQEILSKRVVATTGHSVTTEG